MGNSLYIEKPYSDALKACGLDSVRGILEQIDGHVAAWSRTTDTLLVPCPNGGPGFYLKRYRYPTWRHRLRGTFRGTFFQAHRGQAEFRLLHGMRTLGIPAIRPVAFGAHRVGHYVEACFLITEEVPDAVNLTRYASDVQADRIEMSAALRREMCVELAERIAAMHSAGFAHGQLFWRNILVRSSCCGRPEFFFLDARPGRGRRWFARRSERYLMELAHLVASALPFTTASDRLRFLKAYLRSRHIQFDPRRASSYLSRLATRFQPHERQRIRMAGRFDRWNEALLAEQQRLGRSA